VSVKRIENKSILLYYLSSQTIRDPFMSSSLKKIAQLQLLLSEMEEDFGIKDNSTIEKRVLLALADLSSKDEAIATHDIMNHQLIYGFSRPSFYRALLALEEQGKIRKAKSIRGFYALCAE